MSKFGIKFSFDEPESFLLKTKSQEIVSTNDGSLRISNFHDVANNFEILKAYEAFEYMSKYQCCVEVKNSQNDQVNNLALGFNFQTYRWLPKFYILPQILLEMLCSKSLFSVNICCTPNYNRFLIIKFCPTTTQSILDYIELCRKFYLKQASKQELIAEAEKCRSQIRDFAKNCMVYRRVFFTGECEQEMNAK